MGLLASAALHEASCCRFRVMASVLAALDAQAVADIRIVLNSSRTASTGALGLTSRDQVAGRLAQNSTHDKNSAGLRRNTP